MGAIIIDFATRRAARPALRIVEPPKAQVGKDLLEAFRASSRLVPALSDWQGRRVIVRALMLTGRVEGWCPEARAFAVVCDDGSFGFHEAAALDRLPPRDPRPAA